MERLARFPDNRWVGDKRNQVVHDVDNCTSAEVLDELMQAETFIGFAPDTLAEARNRGYHRCTKCEGARRSARDELAETAAAADE
jgi:hypothetical protein